MIRVRLILFGTVIILGAFAGGNSAAQITCPAFPSVPWWKGLSHESTTAIVEKKFDGDWEFYADAWKRQLAKLRQIRRKGSTAIIKNKAQPGKKIRLRGAKLISYIGNVKQRLAVIRCLASPTNNTALPAAAFSTTSPPSRIGSIFEPEKAKTCMMCHGDKGISTNPAVPNLAGQNKLYLVKQLKEFQAGPPPEGRPFGATERHNRIMKRQVKYLDDAEIWALSAYFAALPACWAGRENITEMKPPLSAEKCVQCHSRQWNGVLPGVPRLSGQPRQYLLRQLYAFRASADRQGRNRGPNKETRYHFLMSAIAKDMNKAEFDELAQYYAGQRCWKG